MIKGENINLRPIEVNDLEQMYTWFTNQEYNGEFMGAEMRYKDAYIENMKKNLTSEYNFIMVIEDKKGTPLGIVNYLNSMASKVSVDFGILIAEKDNRGKGVGKEAINLLVDYLFNIKNISRIQFMTRNDNKGMKALGETIGFKLDGILRKYTFEFGRYRDLCVFGMTRDDWKEKRAL